MSRNNWEFLQLVVLYVDFKLDESYTPSKISIRAGDGFHNLKVIRNFQYLDPNRISGSLCFTGYNNFECITLVAFRKLKPWSSLSQLVGFIYPCPEMIQSKCRASTPLAIYVYICCPFS